MSTFEVRKQTPQEAWNGQKPTISHLKVFGSIAYAHVPDQRRTKLKIKVKSIYSLDMMRRQKGTSYSIL